MTSYLKILLALAVLLPTGGFVAGMLSERDTAPEPRETIVISGTADQEDSRLTTPAPDARTRPGVRLTRQPAPAPAPAPAPVPAPVPDDDDDDEAPQVVVPPPVDVGDGDDQDDDDGGDDGDD